MEQLSNDLARQIQWIAAADHKIGTVFAIAVAMCGVLAALVPAPAAWTFGKVFFFAVSVGGLLACIGSLACAAFPRTDGPRGSMVYFGGITQHDEETFIEKILGEPSADLRRDFARQIFRNAQIACLKYKWIRRSMQALFVAVLPWLISVYLLYSSYVAKN